MWVSVLWVISNSLLSKGKAGVTTSGNTVDWVSLKHSLISTGRSQRLTQREKCSHAGPRGPGDGQSEEEFRELCEKVNQAAALSLPFSNLFLLPLYTEGERVKEEGWADTPDTHAHTHLSFYLREDFMIHSWAPYLNSKHPNQSLIPPWI